MGDNAPDLSCPPSNISESGAARDAENGRSADNTENRYSLSRDGFRSPSIAVVAAFDTSFPVGKFRRTRDATIMIQRRRTDLHD
jgi:hypothetical protein